MARVLTTLQQFAIIDNVWLGYTVPEAFEEVGLDFSEYHPFLPVDFCAFLIEVSMVAKARDHGIGVDPTREGFQS